MEDARRQQPSPIDGLANGIELSRRERPADRLEVDHWIQGTRWHPGR